MGRRVGPALIPARQSRGFTLLELVLALSVSVLVLTLLSTGLNLVMRDWERAGEQSDRRLDAALALLRLERALEGAFPHSFIVRDANRSEVYFEGTAREVRWVSTVSAGRTPGLTAWRLWRDDEGAIRLARAPAFARDPEPRLLDEEGAVLVADAALEISYLGERREGEPGWRESWTASEHFALPMAVRVRLTPQRRNELDEAAVRTVIAPIRANTNPQFQPVTGQ